MMVDGRVMGDGTYLGDGDGAMMTGETGDRRRAMGRGGSEGGGRRDCTGWLLAGAKGVVEML